MGVDTRRAETKKAILNAMIHCLQEQSFNDITTSHLAQVAGISRSSFYTHYRDKYQLIEAYQKELFVELEEIVTLHDKDKERAFLEIFSLLHREQLLSALIADNGSQEIQTFLINKVRLLIGHDLTERWHKNALSTSEKEYSSIYFAHAFFGIIKAWIHKGKVESPSDMTALVIKLLS